MVVVVVVVVQHSHRYHFRRAAQQGPTSIGADSTGATGNFVPVLTQEPGQTLRFAPVPFMAVL